MKGLLCLYTIVAAYPNQPKVYVSQIRTLLDNKIIKPVENSIYPHVTCH